MKIAAAPVTPTRQRTQYSCMASSMSMCLNALGYETTEDEVNRVMGAAPMRGAAWEQALATAQHYGCRATLTVPSTVEQLKRWTDEGIPVMIAWNPEGRDWSHASVVFDVDEDGNVWVADPNIPDPAETVRVVSRSDFYSKWSEKFPNYLVRRPACAIEREVTVSGQQIAPRTMKTASGRTIRDSQGHTWGPQAGLEGPFLFKNGQVLYYDPREKGGSYYDPSTDMYLSHAEASRIIMRVASNMAKRMLEASALHTAADPMESAAKHVLKTLKGLPLVRGRSLKAFERNLEVKPGQSASLSDAQNLLSRDPAITRLTSVKYRMVETYLGPMGEERRFYEIHLVEGLPGQLYMVKMLWDTLHKESKKNDVKPQVKEKERRDPYSLGLAERGGVGQGRHKNKQDFERGHARKPKHPKQEREGSRNTPNLPTPLGWSKLQGRRWELERSGLDIRLSEYGIEGEGYQGDTNVPEVVGFEYALFVRTPDSAWQIKKELPSFKKAVNLAQTLMQEWVRDPEKATEILHKYFNPRPLYAKVADLTLWVKAAERLLKEHEAHGTGDLYGRAYLRAIISGNSVQATHLAKRFPAAEKMRQELIDAID